MYICNVIHPTVKTRGLSHTFIVNSTYGDEETWYYPKGVEEKIKDNEMYKIWYRYNDSADPMDSSRSYCVYYIERLKEEKVELMVFLKHLLEDLKNE